MILNDVILRNMNFDAIFNTIFFTIVTQSSWQYYYANMLLEFSHVTSMFQSVKIKYAVNCDKIFLCDKMAFSPRVKSKFNVGQSIF